MNIDLADTVFRLGDRPATVFAPALADPDVSKEAFILSHALRLIGPAIDEAPGRLRQQINDAATLIARFDEAQGQASHAALLAEAVDADRLSGLLLRANRLNTALIQIHTEADARDEPWARALRRDILIAFLQWTAPLPSQNVLEQR